MLPKDRRLRRRLEVAAVYRQGRAAFGRYVAVRWRPNGLEVSRFAFAVSRRAGKAVARNRWRRLLREAVRRLSCRVVPGHDVVVRVLDPPSKGAPPPSFAALAADVERVLRRAGLVGSGGRC
ncbi:MAG: ribonuclease P protein component [Moorellales bacterium]